MKRLLVSLVLTSLIAFQAIGQGSKPLYLDQPASWEFESFPLPAGFTPSIHYEGVEELRFAPGFFAKDSVNYFTYAFVSRLDRVTEFSQANLQEYLLAYYKGLAATTAHDKNLSIDSSLVSVKLAAIKSKSVYDRYAAEVNTFGTFADGAPIRLNMEIQVMPDKAGNRTFLFVIVSTQPLIAPVWSQLYVIRDSFKVPG